MDAAYNQHSNHSKRNSRSAVNLNHQSLAPLTPKLPINDADVLPEPAQYMRSPHEHYTSYIEGRSAPTTPGILSRSSSRVNLSVPTRDGLQKSKSSNYIAHKGSHHTASGRGRGRRRAHLTDDFTTSTLSPADRNDSDWLLRAGALISSETRESKGQSWLVSRASSTSLTGGHDDDVEEQERDLARERNSRRTSRRTSTADANDEYSPITTRLSFGGGGRPISRVGSRSASRRSSKPRSAGPLTGPEKEMEMEDYFSGHQVAADPDFVDAEEDSDEAYQDFEDELIIKKLARKGTSGLGDWVEKLMGWNLFSVAEDEEESDTETNEQTTDTSEKSTRSRLRDNGAIQTPIPDETEKMPLPRPDEGGWQDAAWLLSVATKVLL